MLVITRHKLELGEVYEALKEALLDTDELLTPNALQRYEERDDNGKLLEDKWVSIVKRATWRQGAENAEYCTVTVTDYFGGRGVDYSCDDPAIDEKGGLCGPASLSNSNRGLSATPHLPTTS